MKEKQQKQTDEEFLKYQQDTQLLLWLVKLLRVDPLIGLSNSETSSRVCAVFFPYFDGTRSNLDGDLR